jgi:outer membrane protein OmpA-like peptidoglycan-associated protein
VKRVLVGKGILESRISARGVGESDLLIKTTDNVRLRKNRRVSVSIAPAR